MTTTHNLCKTAQHENVSSGYTLHLLQSLHQLVTHSGLSLQLEFGLRLPVAVDHQSHW